MMASYGAPHTSDVPPPYTQADAVYSSATSLAANNLLSSDTLESEVYEYGSKAVTLRFSQRKRRGVRLPAYGREGDVSGEISLRHPERIESVSVLVRLVFGSEAELFLMFVSICSLAARRSKDCNRKFSPTHPDFNHGPT